MNNNLDNMENTELHSTLVYIEEKEFMSDLYPEGLPTNTIIDKTLTAKGATTCELEAKRNSIIVEPNVPVIVGKQNKYPKALGVCEGVTDATIKTYLLDKSIPHKKIIVTPESYSKVKRAADYASINLFKDFFLLIDECEKVVQDAEFRPNIILPFFDFFSFDNKALISATPLLPNLKGFTNHSFTCIKIIPNYDYKKALNLVGTNNVQQEFMNQIFQSGNKTIVTNGDQTDTIYELMDKQQTFEQALRTREFEPDAPNYTPRISGIMHIDNGEFNYAMSILKSNNGNPDACNRYTYAYSAPVAGEGHFIHTYMGDGNPLPSFEGEPTWVDIDGDIDEFTDMVWENLNEDNKVSLFVRYIDIATGEYESRIVNKNK